MRSGRGECARKCAFECPLASTLFPVNKYVQRTSPGSVLNCSIMDGIAHSLSFSYNFERFRHSKSAKSSINGLSDRSVVIPTVFPRLFLFGIALIMQGLSVAAAEMHGNNLGAPEVFHSVWQTSCNYPKRSANL